jgi:hypothetical protein
MSKLLVCLCLAFSALAPLASDTVDVYSSEAFRAEVSYSLGHALRRDETAVVDETYLWYYAKFDRRWDESRFEFAAEKAVNVFAHNCLRLQNPCCDWVKSQPMGSSRESLPWLRGEKVVY